MKTIIQIRLFLIMSMLLNTNLLISQKNNEGNEIRAGILSYKSEGGIGSVSNYERKWMIYPEIIYSKSILNRKYWLKFGLGFKENLIYNSKHNGFGGEYGEINIYKGLIGIEQRYENRIVDLIYGFDFEFEKSKIRGKLLNDVPPYIRQINHNKTSFNVETNIGLRKTVFSKIVIFIETSLVVRISNSKSEESNTEIPMLGSFLDIHYNPINLIGLGYILK